jgi:hypothetical protein
MAVSYKGYIYMSGGRDTWGLTFENDVWRTQDGKTWEQLPKATWPGRSYHIMLVYQDCIYVMGGQTFTTFYNDVWRTCDGAQTWEEITKEAPWAKRAGLAGAVHNGKIVIAGGCYPKSLINPNNRGFFNDVWVYDGVNWTETYKNNDNVEGTGGWSPRSGPRLVSYQGEGNTAPSLYIIAGERGFTPDVQLNGVYKSDDEGATWVTINENPAFSPRSGHGVVIFKNRLVLIAGWPELHDLYESTNTKDWSLVSNGLWGSDPKTVSSDTGRYDFWSLVHAVDGQEKIFILGGSGEYATFGPRLYNETWDLVY